MACWSWSGNDAELSLAISLEIPHGRRRSPKTPGNWSGKKSVKSLNSNQQVQETPQEDGVLGFLKTRPAMWACESRPKERCL